MTKAKAKRNPLETLILDFYAMVGFNAAYIHPDDAGFVPVEADADAAYNVIDGIDASTIKNRVISSVKELFIRDVHFSLCCEVRHILDHSRMTPESFFKAQFGSIGVEWFKVFTDVYYDSGEKLLNYKTPKPDRALIGCYGGYLRSYFAVLTAEENTGLGFHKVCEKVFEPSLVKWDDYFGGQKWLEITRAYTCLLEAEDTWEIIQAIDVLVAIEHNTAFVFDKLAHWHVNDNMDWLGRVLDVKFQAKTPFSFIAMCSPDVQRVFSRVKRLESILKDRSRYRADFKGKKVTQKYLSHEDVERRVIIRNLKEGEAIMVRHDGAEKAFLLDSVYHGGSKNGSFTTYVLRACGWYVPKTKRRGMKFFPFSEDELVDSYIRMADAGEIRKALAGFSRWVRLLHEQFNTLLVRSCSPLILGSCIIEEKIGQARFRLYKAKQTPEGKVIENIRFFASFQEYRYVVLRFTTTPQPIQLPGEENLAPKLTVLDVEADMDGIAPTSLYMVNEIIREAEDLVDPEMLTEVVTYIERKRKNGQGS